MTAAATAEVVVAMVAKAQILLRPSLARQQVATLHVTPELIDYFQLVYYLQPTGPAAAGPADRASSGPVWPGALQSRAGRASSGQRDAEAEDQ